MALAHGFFIIELLITLVLVTWFMGMIIQHNVSTIQHQISASSSFNAMEYAQTILDASSYTPLKQTSMIHENCTLHLEFFPLPPVYIIDAPPSLNLGCLQSVGIAHVTAKQTSSNSPLWCICSVVRKQPS